MLKKLGIGLAALGTVASGVYLLFIRPWHLRWGATDKEVHRFLPGDDLVSHPILKAPRAITIRARATDIWLWLVQMGYGRAGWYSYDWIDNAGIHVTRIIPELQHKHLLRRPGCISVFPLWYSSCSFRVVDLKRGS